jgi:hypothetical protein
MGRVRDVPLRVCLVPAVCRRCGGKTDSPGHMSSRASILIRTLAQVETLTEYIRLETSLQLNDRGMQTLIKALINLWVLQVNHGVQAPHTVSGLSSVHLLS